MSTAVSAIFADKTIGPYAIREYGEHAFCYQLLSDQPSSHLSLPIPQISPEEFLALGGQDDILIATLTPEDDYWRLKRLGLNCIIYQPVAESYYDQNSLVFDPYALSPRIQSEAQWNNNLQRDSSRSYIAALADFYSRNVPLFDHVEIETFNRCNGTCAFCPVNRKDDPRPEAWMSESLFRDIVDQLADLRYCNSFALFSNNEPFLDPRLCDFQHYARQRLPDARMYLFTNGTALTIPVFQTIIEDLDELIVDHYHVGSKENQRVQQLLAYCAKDYSHFAAKVTVVSRDPAEVLSSRAGSAPNRVNLCNIGDDKCVLPFRQLIVRPDGKVSLCCNDAIGTVTLGDLTKESVLDVWYGSKARSVREKLMKGRRFLQPCAGCDSFLRGLRMTKKAMRGDSYATHA